MQQWGFELTRMNGRNIHSRSTWHHSRIHVRLHHEPPWIKAHGSQVLRVGLHGLVQRSVWRRRDSSPRWLGRDCLGKDTLLLLLPLLLFHLFLKEQSPTAWESSSIWNINMTNQIRNNRTFGIILEKRIKRHLITKGGKTKEQVMELWLKQLITIIINYTAETIP